MKNTINISHITFNQYLKLIECIHKEGITITEIADAITIKKQKELWSVTGYKLFNTDVKPMALRFDTEEIAIEMKLKYL